MTDSTLRNAQRKFDQTGSEEDRAALNIARLRSCDHEWTLDEDDTQMVCWKCLGAQTSRYYYKLIPRKDGIHMHFEIHDTLTERYLYFRAFDTGIHVDEHTFSEVEHHTLWFNRLNMSANETERMGWESCMAGERRIKPCKCIKDNPARFEYP